MRTSLQIILIIIFSLNLISCKSEDTEKINEPVSKGGDALGDVLDPIGDGLNDAGDGLNDGLNDGLKDLTGGGSAGGGGSEIIHTKFKDAVQLNTYSKTIMENWIINYLK